jgi:ribonuclease BN (tRNA processing enzyme)
MCWLRRLFAGTLDGSFGGVRMKIRLLGTGTPTPSLKRMSSGYMVTMGDDTLLFDHGTGAHHRLLEAGTAATDVTHLFLTHLHYDHCIDYARLVLTRWDQGTEHLPDLKVFGPEGTAEMTERLFSESGVFNLDLTARTSHEGSLAFYEARGGTLPRPWPKPDVRELRSGDTVEGDGWRIGVQSVLHHQPYLHCFGYRIDTPDGSLTYSGDSGPCKGMEVLAQDCDVMIHMTHYISGTALNPNNEKTSSGHKEVAALAAKANVKTVVVSHVTEQMDVPGVRERLLREMGEIYSGNIIWGEDLMEIPVDGPRPAKLL